LIATVWVDRRSVARKVVAMPPTATVESIRKWSSWSPGFRGVITIRGLSRPVRKVTGEDVKNFMQGPVALKGLGCGSPFEFGRQDSTLRSAHCYRWGNVCLLPATVDDLTTLALRSGSRPERRNKKPRDLARLYDTAKKNQIAFMSGAGL
jgi:hypothetical protein